MTTSRSNEQALARSNAQRSMEQAQYLTFMLGKEMFAIGILVVKEIIEFDQLTVVPMMPESIRGVINLRGAVVPVIDLSARFGRGPAVVTKRSCIVIVDAVNQVLDIPASEIEPPPPFGAKIRTDFIEGMGKVDGRFVILLDVSHVLSVDEIGSLASATAGARGALPSDTDAMPD
jgi:purine-binding chemotaxis protein CheW